MCVAQACQVLSGRAATSSCRGLLLAVRRPSACREERKDLLLQHVQAWPFQQQM